jgi:hypothetical protein
MRRRLLASLLLVTCWGAPAQAEVGCQPAQALVEGNSIEACEAAAEQLLEEGRLGSCVNERPWVALVVERLAQCTRRVMNAELDKRLLKLKRNNRKQFAAEMKLQKFYNQSTEATCARYEACAEGPYFAQYASECRNRFHGYRAHQAALLNQGRLRLPDAQGYIPKVQPKPYQLFATGLCNMPVEVWENGEKPPDCEARALAAFDRDVWYFEEALCPRVSCPRKQRVHLDLEALREQYADESSKPGLTPGHLAKLGLKPEEPACREQADLTSVFVSEAALVSPAPVDRVLGLDFTCSDDNDLVQMLVVLHPLGHDTWCNLGVWEEVSWGYGCHVSGAPIRHEPVHLTEPDRQTLQLNLRRCYRATTETGDKVTGDNVHTVFLDVSGSELKEVFSSSPGDARLIPEGPFPRAILAPDQETMEDIVYQYNQATRKYEPSPGSKKPAP